MFTVRAHTLNVCVCRSKWVNGKISSIFIHHALDVVTVCMTDFKRITNQKLRQTFRNFPWFANKKRQPQHPLCMLACRGCEHSDTKKNGSMLIAMDGFKIYIKSIPKHFVANEKQFISTPSKICCCCFLFSKQSKKWHIVKHQQQWTVSSSKIQLLHMTRVSHALLLIQLYRIINYKLWLYFCALCCECVFARWAYDL